MHSEFSKTLVLFEFSNIHEHYFSTPPRSARSRRKLSGSSIITGCGDFQQVCVLETFFWGGGATTEINRQNTPSITKSLIPKIRGVFSALVCRVTEAVLSGAAVMQTSGYRRKKTCSTLAAGQLHHRLSVRTGHGGNRGKSLIGSRKTSGQQQATSTAA